MADGTPSSSPSASPVFNFTGPRRGRNRTYTAPYWGKFDDVVSTSELRG